MFLDLLLGAVNLVDDVSEVVTGVRPTEDTLNGLARADRLAKEREERKLNALIERKIRERENK